MNESRIIKLTEQGPVFYKGHVRVPIEGGIEISENDLKVNLAEAMFLLGELRTSHRSLRLETDLRRREKTIESSGFTLAEAISNMKRLLKDHPEDVMVWFNSIRPIRSPKFFELMLTYRNAPSGQEEIAGLAVQTFIEEKMVVREIDLPN